MKKRIISFILCFAMLLSLFPTSILAENDPAPGGNNVTTNLSKLVTDVVFENISKADDGSYYVDANTSYSILLKFAENENLEFDMTRPIQYMLPAGVASSSNESGTVNIGVEIDGVFHSIEHPYSISQTPDGDLMTITWNEENVCFDDLALAHGVGFSFYLNAVFDGTENEIKFGDINGIVVHVDNTGTVTITKNITGLKPGFTMSEDEKKAMLFELRDGSGKTCYSFSYADLENGSISFPNMDPGEYTVVETACPDLTDYTFDTVNSVKSATGTLKNGGVLTLDLSNDYDYDTGDLVLNKSVDCTNWDGSKTIPDAIKNNISFTITGPDNYSKTVSYSSFENGKYTLENLPVGEYTVTETNKVTGYTWTYTVNNASADKPSATATVKKNEEAAVSFENTYVEYSADLIIKKTVTGGVTVPAGATFTVTFPDGTTTKTFTYADMTEGIYRLENVPLGEYTVSEDSDSAQVTNYALTIDGTGTVTLDTADESVTKTITNKYSPRGNLMIDKTIAGDLSKEILTDAQKAAIKFEVYDANGGKVGTRTYAQILAGNGFKNIPVGTYTVKESGTDIAGYTVVTDPENKEVKVEVKVGETATASFTNTYTKDAYELTVEKQFADGSYYNMSNLPDDIKNNTVFTVKKGTTTVATCTLAELSTVLNKLALDDPGSYTITETNPTIAGLAIATQVSKNGGAFTNGNSTTITLKNHGSDKVAFKNSYELQGSIKVVKNIVSTGGILLEKEKEDIRNRILFTVYQKLGDNDVKFLDNVTLEELELGVVVPAGEYFIKENGSLGVEGFTGPTVYTRVNDVTVKDSSSDVFTVDQNGNVTVTFTNEYVSGKGSGTVQLVKVRQRS